MRVGVVNVDARAWHRFRANRPALVSACFLAFVVGASFLGPVFWRCEPDAISDLQFAAPCSSHWLGTDVHGRDMLARLLYGTRISFMVGIIGATVSLVIGSLWGATAGYLGGRVDGVMMRIVDILYSLPSIIFVIVLVTALDGFIERREETGLGSGSASAIRMIGLFAGLGCVSWLTMARVVRGQVLSLRNQPFIEAARALGAGHLHILFRHILPNVSGVIIVYLALTIPSVVL
ncbi:MAG: ABC transporter permease, partial [Verrucomicrobiae bacterium]|nr:ABC transporter permease [Verrucomicrobiae bacterium]